jgi:hypothetical protein
VPPEMAPRFVEVVRAAIALPSAADGCEGNALSIELLFDYLDSHNVARTLD